MPERGGHDRPYRNRPTDLCLISISMKIAVELIQFLLAWRDPWSSWLNEIIKLAAFYLGMQKEIWEIFRIPGASGGLLRCVPVSVVVVPNGGSKLIAFWLLLKKLSPSSIDKFIGRQKETASR